MNKKKIKVTWINGSVSYFDSIISCAESLGITTTSVQNYLKGSGPIGSKFEYVKMSGEEQLLRHTLKINPVVRIDE